MFTFVNFILILIAGSNLFALMAGSAPSVGDICRNLVGVDGGLNRLRAALTLAALAQVYLIFLVFPLKAIDLNLGLAWSILMLGSVLETIFTGQKMYQTVVDGDRQATFPVHDSAWYRLYQVIYNVGTIGVCLFLILPRT